jgi:hypothetical protein
MKDEQSGETQRRRRRSDDAWRIACLTEDALALQPEWLLSGHTAPKADVRPETDGVTIISR